MFCSKCGKEIVEGSRFCLNCGTPVPGADGVGNGAEAPKPEVSTEEQVTKCLAESAGTMTVTSIIMLCVVGVGVLLYLFASIIAGCLIALAGLFVAAIPSMMQNSKLKACTKDKALIKKCTNELKKNDKKYKSAFTLTKVATIVCGVFVFLCGIGMMALDGYAASLPSRLQSDDYGSGFLEQLDTIKDLHDFASIFGR